MKLILKSELRQDGWSGCAGGGGPVAQLLRRHEKQIKVNSPISFCGNKVEKNRTTKDRKQKETQPAKQLHFLAEQSVFGWGWGGKMGVGEYKFRNGVYGAQRPWDNF